MREILFRGKNLESEKWVYGDLMENTYIFGKNDLYCLDSYEVDKETIGQYIGLKDKNGVKIFEGDILEDEGTLFTVFYADGGFAIESNPKYFGYGYQDNLNPREPLSDMQMGSYVEDNCEVVGNIHDNKALLGNDR